jgi:hypothetical protein
MHNLVPTKPGSLEVNADVSMCTQIKTPRYRYHMPQLKKQDTNEKLWILEICGDEGLLYC